MMRHAVRPADLDETHWPAFAAMQRDPEVMADLGGPFSESASRSKFERYSEAWKRHGISR